ncbi:calfacilitin isoform X2 [Lingula anatina]|uniref:Calfacilitin isoform X2 n=1 Tax=Lingula anatina TaxID=7574 RepID=A0A1S3KB34_LINAN|nr:calfacilitin isoform X2 [Lingula anatina]XP_013419645.1 calfacilitin isoform X2 [Lingula anatina]|eukprot:XP_013419644.1 calfacilitin isoform X2 [Lingula anatina]
MDTPHASFDEEFTWKGKAVVVIFPTSFLFFTALNRLVSHYTPEKCAGYPDRWTAYVISWLHAILNGSLALVLTLSGREWVESTPWAFYLHCMSAGYFAYDAVAMGISKEQIGSFDIYLHHILCAFFVTASQFPPCGQVTIFVLWDYLCEITNVFLHGRKLLAMLGRRESTLYKRLNGLFLVTFFIFRFFPQVFVFVMLNFDFWFTAQLPLLCYVISIPQQTIVVLIGSNIAYQIVRRSKRGHNKVATD